MVSALCDTACLQMRPHFFFWVTETCCGNAGWRTLTQGYSLAAGLEQVMPAPELPGEGQVFMPLVGNSFAMTIWRCQ